jgi:hypothetical protein
MSESLLTAQSSRQPLEFDTEDRPRKDELLDRISSQLAAWVLLYDIPFCYLLPNKELLGQNCLRFFYLDQNWVFSLLDGALSPGRTAEIDFQHDRMLAKDAYAKAIRESENIRRMLQGRFVLAPLQKIKSDGSFTPETCSGFLMRSPLVTGWRGMEFTAYNKEKKLLRALRIETLAHDVLFALFLGEIDHFTLSEPPEGLHFGFRAYADGLKAGFRCPKNGIQDGKTTFDIPQRGNRVINFAKTAENIKNQIEMIENNVNNSEDTETNIDKNQTWKKMDSAAMALQLTSTAITLTVNV